MITWVNAEERLPEVDPKYGISRVLLCVDVDGRVGFGIFMHGGVVNVDGWFTHGIGGNGRIITHWTELNKPGKGVIA